MLQRYKKNKYGRKKVTGNVLVCYKFNIFNFQSVIIILLEQPLFQGLVRKCPSTASSRSTMPLDG